MASKKRLLERIWNFAQFKDLSLEVTVSIHHTSSSFMHLTRQNAQKEPESLQHQENSAASAVGGLKMVEAGKNRAAETVFFYYYKGAQGHASTSEMSVTQKGKRWQP